MKIVTFVAIVVSVVVCGSEAFCPQVQPVPISVRQMSGTWREARRANFDMFQAPEDGSCLYVDISFVNKEDGDNNSILFGNILKIFLKFLGI